MLAAAVVVAVAAGAPIARAQVAQPPLLRSFFSLPVQIDGAELKLEAMEIRPRGDGPFPLAIFAHGKPSGERQRRSLSALSYTQQVATLARQGFVALVALRRGYGSSQGTYAESDGECEATTYGPASRAGARDLAAIVAAAVERAQVDRARMLVVGESVGGITALAYGAMPAGPHAGVRGIVNFAGGRGGRPVPRGEVCQPEKLVELARALGHGVKLPTLWVYAENDRTFGPALVRQMFGAFLESARDAKLAMLPALARDGHRVMTDAVAQWRPAMDEFLTRTGFSPKATAPTTARPASLDPRQEASFRNFAESPMPFRAFAAAPNSRGAWAGSARSLDEARRTALSICHRSAPVCEVRAEASDVEDR